MASVIGYLAVAFVMFSGMQSVFAQHSSTSTNSSEQHEQKAFDFAKNHQYKEAAAEMRGTSPPSDSKARVQYFRLLAAINSGLGDRHRAAESMEEALAITPNDVNLAWATSVAESDAAEWKACISHVAPLFRATRSAQSGLLLLRAQLAANVEFRSTLRKLHDLDLPDNEKLQVRVHSAELLATADKHPEAAREFEDAVKMSGRDENLLYNLAVEQYSSGEYLSAFATVQMLKEQHDSAEIEDLAGDIEERRGNPQEALRDHEKAAAMARDDERYWLSEGAALLKYREYTKAAEVFQRAADLFPNSARVYAGLGMADYLQEKYDDSVSAFLHADQLDGGAGRALSYLGATQADSPAGPSPIAISAVCSRADAHSTGSAAFTWCGVLRFRKAYIAGDRVAAREAIPQLRRAMALTADDPIPACWLGRALAWTEQLADARRWLEVCVRLRPEVAEDRYQLSRVYVAMGLKQLAARQAALITKLNAERQQNEALPDFAREMLSRNSNRQK